MLHPPYAGGADAERAAGTKIGCPFAGILRAFALDLARAHPQSRAEAKMKERPQIVTILGWFLILKGALLCLFQLSLIGNPFKYEAMAKAHLPIALQYFETFLGYAVAIVVGINLLRGENWARWAFLYWTGFSFVLDLLNAGFHIDPFIFLLINGVIIFLLMRSPAQEFFRPGRPTSLLR